MSSIILTTFFMGSVVTAFDYSASPLYFASYSSAASACSGRVCPASQIASNMPGYYCDQYKAVNPAIHQQAVCQGGTGTFSKTVAAPANCQFNDYRNCWNPNNNCANTPSANCQNWCTCWNSAALGASPTAERLGASPDTPSLGTVIVPRTSGRLGASPDTPSLGHSTSSHVHCPAWLAQAHSQLSPGSPGYTCWQPHQLCSYPAYGMNFVCTGWNGVWQLQGPAPTPAPNACPSWIQIWNGKWCPSSSNNMLCSYPLYFENYVCHDGQWKLQVSPTPTPAPNACPHSSMIWNGKWCPSSSNNMFCSYPTLFKNFVCQNGQWKLQGSPSPPTPEPTPPPVNSVDCPSASYPPTAGNYCTTTGQICNYTTGKFKCNNNGQWITM